MMVDLISAEGNSRHETKCLVEIVKHIGLLNGVTVGDQSPASRVQQRLQQGITLRLRQL